MGGGLGLRVSAPERSFSERVTEENMTQGDALLSAAHDSRDPQIPLNSKP